MSIINVNFVFPSVIVYSVAGGMLLHISTLSLSCSVLSALGKSPSKAAPFAVNFNSRSLLAGHGQQSEDNFKKFVKMCTWFPEGTNPSIAPCLDDSRGQTVGISDILTAVCV